MEERSQTLERKEDPVSDSLSASWTRVRLRRGPMRLKIRSQARFEHKRAVGEL